MISNNYNFSEFDEVIISYFEIAEDFILPLKIDIADIRIKQENIKQVKIKVENNTLNINKMPSPYETQYAYLKFENDTLSYMDYIDCDSRLFEGNTKNLLQHLGLKNKLELVNLLIKEMEVPLQVILNLKQEIELYKSNLMNSFLNRLKEYLIFNDNLPEWKPDTKGINPKNYDTAMSQTYIKIQSMMEYHNSTPFFAENKGKSYSEWSWREIQLRLMFLNRKNQTDSEQNRMQNDMYKTLDTGGKK